MLDIAGQQGWGSSRQAQMLPGTKILRRDISEAKSLQSLKGQQRKRGQRSN